MSKGAYLLRRDSREAQEELEKQAKKKGLWGSLGRTLGGLAAMALTGGAATPLAAGLMAAGGTALGGAIGANQVKLKGSGQSSKFFKEERGDLAKDLSGLGTENLTSALTAGMTAGATQAAAGLTEAGKAAKAAKKAAGRGALDFGTSIAGKGVQAGQDLLSQYLDSLVSNAAGSYNISKYRD
tara:strand:- start:2162 stop:2710 length:549 start_codon:yes stop_codon:yes gene_type:complete